MNKINRREFLNYLIGGGILAWIGSIIYPVVKFLFPPEFIEEITSVKAGTLDTFQKDSFKIVKLGKSPVIVVRKVDGNFTALSAVCTHLSCIVQYRTDMKAIYCGCHGGVFNLDGKNISGPPPKALTLYEVKILKDEVYVTKVKEI